MLITFICCYICWNSHYIPTAIHKSNALTVKTLFIYSVSCICGPNGTIGQVQYWHLSLDNSKSIDETHTHTHTHTHTDTHTHTPPHLKHASCSPDARQLQRHMSGPDLAYQPRHVFHERGSAGLNRATGTWHRSAAQQLPEHIADRCRASAYVSGSVVRLHSWPRMALTMEPPVSSAQGLGRRLLNLFVPHHQQNGQCWLFMEIDFCDSSICAFLQIIEYRKLQSLSSKPNAQSLC